MALCRDRTPVHTVITDIQLNGSGGGWEVAKAFRALWGNIPVVYTSGNLFEAQYSVPDSWFFSKPYECDEIVAKCQQLIAGQSQ